MPVFFTGREPDHVAGPDLLNRAAFALRPAASRRNNKRLAERMRVPRCAGAGSNVTLAPCTSAGADAWNRGSIRTIPVNHSAGPFADGCKPTRLISMYPLLEERGFDPVPLSHTTVIPPSTVSAWPTT